jgi:hypothetical protein
MPVVNTPVLLKCALIANDAILKESMPKITNILY